MILLYSQEQCEFNSISCFIIFFCTLPISKDNFLLYCFFHLLCVCVYISNTHTYLHFFLFLQLCMVHIECNFSFVHFVQLLVYSCFITNIISWTYKENSLSLHFVVITFKNCCNKMLTVEIPCTCFYSHS
jgi:hypothetical protein